MGLTNHGKINTHHNAVDGVHVGEKGKLDNFGEINSHDNGRHGIFVAEDIATLKANIDQANALLDKEDLRFLREKLEPLFIEVTQALEAPQVNTTGVRNILSKITTHLSGVGQGVIGNVIYSHLPNFNQLHSLVDAGIQLLS